MSDIKFIQFLYLIRNCISPIEGVLALVYQKRDYNIYIEIVISFIELFKATTTAKNNELLQDLSKYLVTEDLRNKLSSYLHNYRVENQSHTIKIDEPLFKIMSNSNTADMDKINFLLEKILNGKSEYRSINVSYSKAKKRDDKNIGLTNELNEQIKEFVPLFATLHQNNNKSLDSKIIQIIASTEFFNAMNHLSIALLDSDAIEDACIKQNLHQAQGHLSRAVKDMKKIDMYLCGLENITLENFQKRIQEVSPSNTGC